MNVIEYIIKYTLKIGLGSVIPSSSSCVKNNGVPKNKQ